MFSIILLYAGNVSLYFFLFLDIILYPFQGFGRIGAERAIY